MHPLALCIGDAGDLFHGICTATDMEPAELEHRCFPDGESYLRLKNDCAERPVVLFCNLDRPDHKIMPALLAAELLREHGASQIGLVAPYLPYMRQDSVFKPGEGVTARYFAALISRYFDWLLTVDPHLHRIHSLDEIFSIPAKAAHAAPALSTWIEANVELPLIVGPDSESEQWVSEVAKSLEAPYVILTKSRSGDRDVRVSMPDASEYRDHVPVLVDDIASTGHTLVAAIQSITRADMVAPVCAVVHGLFSEDGFERIKRAGAEQIVSCNTVVHPSNAIDVSDSVSAEYLQMLTASVSQVRRSH